MLYPNSIHFLCRSKFSRMRYFSGINGSIRLWNAYWEDQTEVKSWPSSCDGVHSQHTIWDDIFWHSYFGNGTRSVDRHFTIFRLAPFLNDSTILSGALNALEMDMEYVGCAQSDVEYASRLSELHVASTNVNTNYSAAFYPLHWWHMIGFENSTLLFRFVRHVLSLSCSSTAVEHSFKVKSRVHCQTRTNIRFLNAECNPLSFLIY